MSYVARNHPQQGPAPGVEDPADDRAVPFELFDRWNERFHFTVDAAASAENARLPRFWTREDDGLHQPWAGERVWCNPPYSDIKPWVTNAWYGSGHPWPELVVMLLPANRTEQGWWQKWVEPYRDGGHPYQRPVGSNPLRLAVEFLPGRIRFTKGDRDQSASMEDLFGRRATAAVSPNERPPFGCCLLIWRNPFDGEMETS